MLQAVNVPQFSVSALINVDNISPNNHSSIEVQHMDKRSRYFPKKLFYSSVISTVFSTYSHILDTLYKKLKQYGIQGKIHHWIENYLSDRWQRVVIEGKSSEFVKLTSGVPQGSILGPLLFLIYINDLLNRIANNVRIYADDSSLYVNYARNKENNDAEMVARYLQEDITRVEEWARNWRIEFNASKTESLVFSRKHEIRSPGLYMKETRIKEVTEHKHLGIILQQNGKWKQHMEEMGIKAKKKIDVLRLRSLMTRINRKSLQKLYLTYIRPCLEYGATIWDNCPEYEKEELEKIQLAGLRVITGGKRGTSHQLLYGDTGIETLQCRRDKRKLVTMYKMQTGNAPETLKTLLPGKTGEKTNKNLRTASHTSLIKAKHDSYHTSFLPDTIRKWNSLPQETRKASTLETFKLRITDKKTEVPKYIYYGERRPQIAQTRMRLRRSDLKEDLFEVNLAESPLCECKEAIEDAEHYLKDCELYKTERTKIKDTYGIDFKQYHTEDLLEGNPRDTYEDNLWRFHAVQEFIKKTKRFR